MNYIRVLPRDAFNEASLLKCIGKLWILTERMNKDGFMEEDVPSFIIKQSQDDGSISVSNLTFTIKGETVTLSRPLNSREAWPLYAELGDNYLSVFNNEGELDSDFLALFDRS